MISEFRKSIQSVLYERISSPFSGAFFFSWCVWNWKLLYYLLFADEIVIDRITFVETHYINIKNGLLYPFLSTIFLIIIFPFIATGAYWVWLKFKSWQYDLRNKVENKQLLSFEKSIELREEIRNQEIRFDKINQNKDNEIKFLKEELSTLLGERNKLAEEINSKQKEIVSLYESLAVVNKVDSKKDNSTQIKLTSTIEEEFSKILSSQHIRYYKVLIDTITKGYTFNYNTITTEVVSFFESHGIIERQPNGTFRFTAKGLLFNQMYYKSLS